QDGPAPAVVSGPVSERERDGQAQQRPPIPGLPPGKQAIAAAESGDAGTTTMGAAATARGGNAPQPVAADREADTAPASRVPAAERTIDAVLAAKAARPADSRQRVEPPTVPGAAARPAGPRGAVAGPGEHGGQGESPEPGDHGVQGDSAGPGEPCGHGERA